MDLFFHSLSLCHRDYVWILRLFDFFQDFELDNELLDKAIFVISEFVSALVELDCLNACLQFALN